MPSARRCSTRGGRAACCCRWGGVVTPTTSPFPSESCLPYSARPMSQRRYVTLGSLHAGEGSRAVLGLDLATAAPVVLVQAPEALVRDPQLAEGLQRETA